jgi:hypothetical protein
MVRLNGLPFGAAGHFPVLVVMLTIGAGALLHAARAAEPPDQFRVWGTTAKANPYLGDPGMDSPGTMTPEASDMEKSAGFVIFTKPPGTVISSDFVPAQADRVTRLTARDCPGQYGVITFGVFVLRESGITVTVKEITGPGGAEIGPENFDIRAVRYVKVADKKGPQVVPLLIEAPPKAAVPANRFRQFWITYFIPPGAAPGTYRGTNRVLAGGAEKAAIPLELEVHPFKLTEPDVDLYIYQGNWFRQEDLDWSLKGLTDQRCHGMNLAGLTPPVTRAGDLQREPMLSLLELYKKAGFPRPHVHVGLWNRITSEWLNAPDPNIKMYGQWFRYYPFSDVLDKRYVETVRFIRDEAKKRGWRLVLAVADEAGSHPWTTEATQHYNDLIKRELPDVVRELTVGGGWAMKRPEDELWKGRINVWTTNRWLVDKLEIVRRDDPNARIGIYNMGGGGSRAGGIEAVRCLYGFFCWKARACGAAQWTYFHSATPEDNYTWPGEDGNSGHVPTPRWEMLREGAKDRRYLATLEQKLAGKTGKDADEARALLREIAEKVELRTFDYDPIVGGRVPVQPVGTYDLWRTKIADHIRRLSQ